jgi:hypothetical protein
VLSEPTDEPDPLGLAELAELAEDATAEAALVTATEADGIAELIGVPTVEVVGTAADKAVGGLPPEQPTASTETKTAATTNGALPRFMR